MPRLIPRSEYLEKRAALSLADSMGRELAHDRVVYALAEDVGQLLKEAGFFSKVKEFITGRFGKVKAPRISGRRGVEASRAVAAKSPAAKARAQQQYIQKNVEQLQAAKATPSVQQAAAPVTAPPGKVLPAKAPQRGARLNRAELRARTGQDPYRTQAAGAPQPAAAPAPAPAKPRPGQLRGREGLPGKAPRRKGEAPAGEWGRRARGGYAAPGQVRPAVGGEMPGKVVRAKEAPRKTEGLGGELEAKRRAEAERLTKGKGKMPGIIKYPLYGAAGLAGLGLYGAYKAAPHVLRTLEQTSTTPMAPSMGWSPTPYGYGYTPYGPGSPTMGYGG